ncbi:hypothetical protein CXF78_09020 [Shewanella sp. 11B5]|uniref:hypothetical protein n=1 Tax=unclassified Shewanella TaxID=196818 RepID=UPI000C7BB7DB|nr:MULTISPECIES: hypothetical protein [unclassified Shewanella]MBB1364536.1 hypothetical protein [Shewanella sp. SR44-4]PKI06713.1 hypothetical protein CXF78_09020 [Shewanella sp. 11B5]
MTSKFNKVFSVYLDPDEFMLLSESAFEHVLQLTENRLLSFNGNTPMKEFWGVLNVVWQVEPSNKLKLKVPDIAGLGASTFVVSPMYSQLFLNDFGENIELLECNNDGAKWFAFNVLGFDNALNEELSERNMRNGRPDRIRKFKRMVFNKSGITNPNLFRVRETGLFYYTTDAENSLYSIVKKNNISGLFFKEVECY